MASAEQYESESKEVDLVVDDVSTMTRESTMLTYCGLTGPMATTVGEAAAAIASRLDVAGTRGDSYRSELDRRARAIRVWEVEHAQWQRRVSAWSDQYEWYRNGNRDHPGPRPIEPARPNY